ncbi:MAG TPA: type II secretion system F family protein [Verrucomicrobiae bacterium]|jgi:tight adherence protein C|nr:type II secretion system F family protein [Verrucomicrobiae bacterium]
MVWTITILTFLASMLIAGSVLYALTPKDTGVASRLTRLFKATTPVVEEKFAMKQKGLVRDTLVSVGKLGSSGKSTRKQELMMLRAGYRSPEAMLAMTGFKILLPVVLLALVFLTGLYQFNAVLAIVLAVIIGYLGPDIWLTSRVKARQRLLRRALPDGLDLLVICVEAGIGLDQALLRVSEELALVHPLLSDELRQVNFEMRMGKTRLDAMRELARRTGLDDIKALVSMLIQTERFGTSVSQSLRIHSDELRMKRRQRAEEQAAKTTVKMVPALVFFIFPALMVVILGPAIIAIMRQLMPTL